MWLPKEERHFAVTLLFAGVGAVLGAVGLMVLIPMLFSLTGGAEDVDIEAYAWLIASLIGTVLSVLLMWRVCKRRGAVRYADESRAGGFPVTVLLVVAGAPLAAASVILLPFGAALNIFDDSDLGRGIGQISLVVGVLFAVPALLLFSCAWMRRPTRAR